MGFGPGRDKGAVGLTAVIVRALYLCAVRTHLAVIVDQGGNCFKLEVDVASFDRSGNVRFAARPGIFAGQILAILPEDECGCSSLALVVKLRSPGTGNVGGGVRQKWQGEKKREHEYLSHARDSSIVELRPHREKVRKTSIVS